MHFNSNGLFIQLASYATVAAVSYVTGSLTLRKQVEHLVKLATRELEANPHAQRPIYQEFFNKIKDMVSPLQSLPPGLDSDL